jgi:hypothetical protein
MPRDKSGYLALLLLFSKSSMVNKWNIQDFHRKRNSIRYASINREARNIAAEFAERPTHRFST